MNRIEIKELAKEKIKGNLWDIWWPLLIIAAIESILEMVFKVSPTIDYNTLEQMSFKLSTTSYIGLSLISILGGIMSAGYLKYIVNFVRTGSFDSKDIINTIKEKWVDILIAVILVSIIVFFCSLLLVIPGIIMALAYTLAVFLVIDKNVKGNDSLKESREIMKGHKWEYFVFGLSFIGWALLVPLTLGILCIWLVPYVTVANAIYYDKLTKDYAVVKEKK